MKAVYRGDPLKLKNGKVYDLVAVTPAVADEVIKTPILLKVISVEDSTLYFNSSFIMLPYASLEAMFNDWDFQKSNFVPNFE
jgi:hypothetical protein